MIDVLKIKRFIWDRCPSDRHFLLCFELVAPPLLFLFTSSALIIYGNSAEIQSIHQVKLEPQPWISLSDSSVKEVIVQGVVSLFAPKSPGQHANQRLDEKGLACHC